MDGRPIPVKTNIHDGYYAARDELPLRRVVVGGSLTAPTGGGIFEHPRTPGLRLRTGGDPGGPPGPGDDDDEHALHFRW